MPKTLYRYILTEVARVTAVSALALVLVMAFGAAVKPLADGMLGAGSLLKFVLFMAPSMLQYALPFAAAMGSTLVYLRLSQDNEVLACQASGMSSLRVVAPTFLLGGVLMVALVGLSGAVAPAFYRKAIQTARGDVVSAMVRKLSGGQSFVDAKSGIVLYADGAEIIEVAGKRQGPLEAEMAIKLKGVVVGQLDKKTGQVAGNLIASGAVGVIYRDTVTGDAVVAMRLEDPDIVEHVGEGDKPKQAHFVRARAIDHLWFELPNPVGDKVEFLSLGQLVRILGEPSRFDAVRRRVDALAQAVAMEKFRREIEVSLDRGAPFKGPLGEETYTLAAPSSATSGADGMTLEAQGGRKVVVEHRAGGAALRRFEADAGDIRFVVDRETGEPVAKLKLTGVRVSEPRLPQAAPAHKPEHAFDILAWPTTLLPDAEKLGVDAWISGTARAADKDKGAVLAQAREKLIEECAILRNKVVAQFHVRAASALLCLLLAVLGALMSLWRRGSLPLVVYFWCFLTAIVAIILINAGGNIAKSSGARFYGGLALVWAPIVLQAVFCARLLVRLKKPGL